LDWNKKTLAKINVAHEFYFLKIIVQQLTIIQNRAFFKFFCSSFDENLCCDSASDNQSEGDMESHGAKRSL